jgi:hypothetical protein
MPKNSSLIATRRKHFTIILDALYILCCMKNHDISTLNWLLVKSIICSDANMKDSSLEIEVDGQRMTYGDYIRKNYSRLRDHFHNHVCLNYAKQTRRSTGLFLQMFLTENKLSVDMEILGKISKKDVLKWKLECKLKQDVFETFMESKLKEYIDEEIDSYADEFAKSLWC